MSVQITISARNARLVAKALEDWSADVPRISAGRIRGRMEGARVKLGRYPERYAGEPKNVFVSEKQRRYVMMLVRSGAVPYRRTRRYGDNWKVVKSSGSGNRQGYTLRNYLDYARYVGGDAGGSGQYRLHAGRWPVAREVVEDEVKDLPQEIQSAVMLAAKRRGL